MLLANIFVKYQDPQTSTANPNGTTSGENSYPDAAEILSGRSDHCDLLPMGSAGDNQPSVFEQSNVVNGNTSWGKSEKLKGKVNEDVLEQPKMSSNKKRMRNLSSKSKRLLMHNDDAVDLKVSWEETQDLLRPPPSVEPTIVMIEDFEFEEYSVSTLNNFNCRKVFVCFIVILLVHKNAL